ASRIYNNSTPLTVEFGVSEVEFALHCLLCALESPKIRIPSNFSKRVILTSRITAKLACWSHERMLVPVLGYYLAWLKEQLKPQVVKLFQVQYQLIFCFWVLAIASNIVSFMAKYHVIPRLTEILTETEKQENGM
ncbi:unnamed protein product, partial [Didymodactylos carnosus]